MSDRIKPSDISCDFAEIAEELFKEGYWSHATKHHAANFLNEAMQDPIIRAAFVAEAIERGEASPTVWVITGRRNDDQTRFVTDHMFAKQSEAQHESIEMNNIANHATYRDEHWKGNSTP